MNTDNPSVFTLAEAIKRAAQAFEAGNLDEAHRFCTSIVAQVPEQIEALNLLGSIHARRGDHQGAKTLLMRALALRPDYAPAISNLGIVLSALGQLDEALAAYDRALALQPATVQAHSNRAGVLDKLGRSEEALAAYEAAISIDPDFAEAHYNKGVVLKALLRSEEALAAYDRALALKPDWAEVHYARANALSDLGRPLDALSSFDKALRLNPAHVAAWNNRGNTLRSLKRFDEAIACMERVLALQPDYEFLDASLIHTRLQTGDWTGLSESLSRLRSDVAQGKRVAVPFAALGLIDSAEFQAAVARTYVKTRLAPSSETSVLPVQSRRQLSSAASPAQPIRIGYFSADLHDHATSYLMAELFESHDPSRFEWFAFSFGPRREDRTRNRLRKAFTQFNEVGHLSDAAVSRLARDLGLHIAVDLKGYTQDCRPKIFLDRCAPIQINYLGYPGTMGTSGIDYLIGDETVVPASIRATFTEKIVYMPGCYQVNDSQRPIASLPQSRETLGLPADAMVYCCFNNSYKIQPDVFDRWMRILRAVEPSVLWLLEDNPWVASNFRREAAARGVSPDRLIFAPRMPLDEHLARHSAADLFLDTLPYNAHTTASDALWAGLPVLTLMGEAFPGRVAASLLRAVGLPDLIAATRSDYESIAIALARDPARRAALRARLAQGRTASPLFDGKRFTRYLEAAYQIMADRYRAGLSPADILADHLQTES